MKDALAGIRVIDLSVNAPGPFATRILADLGAEVTVIENPRAARPDYAGAEGDPLMDKRGGPLDACVAPVAQLEPGGPLPTLEDVFGPNA